MIKDVPNQGEQVDQKPLATFHHTGFFNRDPCIALL